MQQSTEHLLLSTASKLEQKIHSEKNSNCYKLDELYIELLL